LLLLLLLLVLLRRVLVTSDLLANAITLLVLVIGIIRLQVATADGQAFVYLGPKHTLTHLACTIPVLLSTCLGPLALMLFRPTIYFKHRMVIVTCVRVLRLLLVHLTVSAPNSAAAPTIARIAVARAWESPNTGLVILVTGVVVYYLHHFIYLLPWKLAGTFQLATTCAVLHWCGRFPCFLQQAQREAGVVQHPWQERASHACHDLQSYAALFRTALGASLSDFSASICEGEAVISVLQIFWALVGLLVIPTLTTHELERWMCLRYQQQQVPQASTVTAHHERGASSSRGSQFAAGSSRSRSGWSVEPLPPRSINSVTAPEMLQLTDGPAHAGSACGHAAMLVLVLMLGLPVLWLMAEFLAAVSELNRDCTAVLTASH
jgi:hypothetical protein